MSASQTPSSDPGITVIGAGCGGLECALGLRAQGWRGAITIYEAEEDWPYHKPPLSKAHLKGSLPEAELPLKTPQVLERAEVTLVLGAEVAAIERGAKRLRFADGRPPARYDRLILALGGRARGLPGWPAPGEAANLCLLRSLRDAEALRSKLRPGARLIVVGAGFIGLEVAASARALGLEVLVLEAGSRVLARAVAPQISAHLQERHRAEGVEIRLNASVEKVHLEAGEITGLQINGRLEPCDLVVLAVGQSPAIGLAEAAGLQVADGILVDEGYRTSDPAIHAIGDCARFPSAVYAKTLRLESVPNALNHARRLAAQLTAQAPVAEEVPWFWTDQYDLGLKMAGLPGPEDRLVLRGDPAAGAFSVLHLREGLLTAVQSVNRPADFMGARKLIERGQPVDEAALSDCATPLMKLLRAA